jgi:hypothetical protein
MTLHIRHEARRLGLKVYKGSPCLRGHAGLRYTSTGGCVECIREGMRTRAKAKAQRKAQLHVSDIR